ncbi:hypothetical protein CLV78_10395 [Aliiruegeria haliotis]|uniref:O-antigen ligase-like membrane protein n=1 Tax=Aliiruegeria haliotis TaxID=1280846 RepID=A0A2T0RSU8_9RHOB|nr:hypothetical protein [Aliiruegeria haliotis]PRY24231.1 hypothetical protein CLV78_10395 [Aliiruegeria haliotis]
MNAFAYGVLLLWPAVALLVFRRLPLGPGIAAAILGAFLVLPAGGHVDLPLLPVYNKSFAGLLGGVLLIWSDARLRRQFPNGARAASYRTPGWFPRSVWVRVCLLAVFCGVIGTVAANGDTFVVGRRVLRGMTSYDGFAAIQSQILVLLPFWLAWKYMADPQSQRGLLYVLAIGAAFYIMPVLYEVRMSPQLSRAIYGFFPHSFEQHIRGGGFRPIVFMSHGLVVGYVLMLGGLASVALIRLSSGARSVGFLVLSIVFLTTIVLSRNLGATLISLVFAPVMLLCSRRLQLIAASCVALALLCYPVIRSTNLIPFQSFANVVSSLDPGRASSLMYRVHQEEQLLERVRERPVLGWGGWGRNRVYDADGRDASVTDGVWMLLLGSFGWVGYLSRVGLMVLPVVLTTLRQRALAIDATAVSLCVILAANLVDLVPNSSLTSLTWLVAGSLAGRLEYRASATVTPDVDPAAPRPAWRPASVTRAASPYMPVPRDRGAGATPSTARSPFR